MPTFISNPLRARLPIVALFVSLSTVACAQPQPEPRTGDEIFIVEPVVGGLEHVWAMAFLPNGDMLVTERPGRLRVVRDGAVDAEPVSGVPAVHAQGQGGLLDVILHPDFASNSIIYLSYSKPVGDNSTTAVARARYEDGALLDVEDIFVAQSEGRGHYGSRLAFDAAGYLFITVGDRQAPPRGDLSAHPAQQLTDHHGTVIRLHDDGRIPQDNPFVGQANALPEIWSWGHRNAQGLAVHPVTDQVWLNEHGPQGGDELNLVQPAQNYGWPVIGYGVNYGGSELHDTTQKEGMTQPVYYWVPSIATSGLLIYTGEAFPEWDGNFFVGGLAGQQLARLTMDGQEVVSEETLLKDIGRVRDVRQGPEGYVYVALDSPGGSPSIVRLVPKP
ncbi:MAG: PQQ-dependent sugar dehydrogenase [Rhodothermales bacterium]